MKSPVDKSQQDHYLDIFRAMSEPLRAQIISMIAETDELGCTVLEEALPVSKSTISYHIKILSRAGLIDVRKEGRFYFYRLRRHVFDFYLPAYLERTDRSIASR